MAASEALFAAPKQPSVKRHSDSEDDSQKSKKSRSDLSLSPSIDRIPPADDESRTMFNDNPHELLLRSVAIILAHVGFSGASQEALEALCTDVDAYASHFLSQITSHMLLGRRHESHPLDFSHALSAFNLPISSIEPHLHPPTKPLGRQEQVPPPPDEEQNRVPLIKLLGQDLDGANDKDLKSYIPKHFPAFPSKHTYKQTEEDLTREQDPRRIREEASTSARQGEEALRRLMNISKVGQEKDVKRMAESDPKSKLRHELWEKAMQSLQNRKTQATEDSTTVEEEVRGVIVNAESQYFRKQHAKKGASVSTQQRT